MYKEEELIKILNAQHQINEGIIMTIKSCMMRLERMERIWLDVEKDLNNIEEHIGLGETPTGLGIVTGTDFKGRFTV